MSIPKTIYSGYQAQLGSEGSAGNKKPQRK